MKDRVIRMEKRQEESGLEGLLDGGKEGENKSQPKGSNPPQTDTGIEGGFTLETLKGKSVAEIEELVKLADATIRDQGRRLNELSRNPAPAPTVVVAPKVEEEEEIDPADFWKNPGVHLRKQQSKTIEAVKGVMEDIISPFRDNLKESKVEAVWSQLFAQYPDATHIRGIIEESLKQAGITEPKLGALETLYFSIKGRLAHAGKTVEDFAGKPRGSAPKSEDPPLNPQHRPSSHPIPKKKDEETLRDLTENERVMARKRWPNLPAKEAYKRFLDWMDEDEGAIIDSQIGKEPKK